MITITVSDGALTVTREISVTIVEASDTTPEEIGDAITSLDGDRQYGIVTVSAILVATVVFKNLLKPWKGRLRGKGWEVIE